MHCNGGYQLKIINKQLTTSKVCGHFNQRASLMRARHSTCKEVEFWIPGKKRVLVVAVCLKPQLCSTSPSTFVSPVVFGVSSQSTYDDCFSVFVYV